MKGFIATTESGKQYLVRDGIFTIIGDRITCFKVWTMQSAKFNPADGDVIGVPWKQPEAWEDVTTPTIGMRLYLAGKDEWRISTPIQKVEEWRPFAYHPDWDGYGQNEWVISEQEALQLYDEYVATTRGGATLGFENWAAVNLDTELPSGTV